MKNTYRDGKVHLMKQMCPTCIFRPGNKMQLENGRVEEMVAAATRDNSAIICHSTLDVDNAVCRGFFDRHATQTLRIAERLNVIVEV